MAFQFDPHTLSELRQDRGSNKQASLKPLEDLFDHFVDHLRHQPLANPIPELLLPEGAIVVEPSRDDPIRGLKYSAPYFINYERWIEDYGKSTGAKFKMITRKGKTPEYQEAKTYFCDQGSVFMSRGTGCEGQITITLPKDESPETMEIEIIGHTKHLAGNAFLPIPLPLLCSCSRNLTHSLYSIKALAMIPACSLQLRCKISLAVVSGMHWISRASPISSRNGQLG